MNNSRRKFIGTSVLASLSVPLLASGFGTLLREKIPAGGGDRALKKKRILILGGTSFLGIHQVKYALDRGHEVSIFTRGKTVPALYPELFEKVEHLIGDRKDDLSALENRHWDAVIDNSGRDATWTDKSAALLKNQCAQYLYTSSTGVYYPYLSTVGYTEEFAVAMEEPSVVDNEVEKIEYWYAVMKANSEQAALKHFGADRTIIVRPTYMVGPADKTNRFIHWPIRLARGGEVMVPGKKSDVVQYIDVRDVAQWMIRLIEEGRSGTYNAVGPEQTQTMQGFVKAAQNAFDISTSFTHLEDYSFLEREQIVELVPWVLPTGKNIGSSYVSGQKAFKAGLTCTPVAQTIQETYAWWMSDLVSTEARGKVESDPTSWLNREAEILARWQKWK